MQRIRIGILGAGPMTEWAILPALSGPDAWTPPDRGVWWNRRPTSASDIPYQPPARPEVVALADFSAERVRRVAGAARVRGVYEDWKLMLREAQLDALLCPLDGIRAGGVTVAQILDETSGVHGGALRSGGARWIWLDGPPAFSVADALALQKRALGGEARLWCARPLRRAAAHRAAWSLAQEKQIGEITAVALRWNGALQAVAPLSTPRAAQDESTRETVRRFASSYAALDLLLAAAAATSRSAQTARPLQTLASSNSGAASVWLKTANEVTATALFANADAWNSPLPRLELCGTQGRSLICEAGRRLWLHQPGQAAHLMEPPGLALHLSASGALGVAEDLKAFLNACAEEGAPRLELGNATEYSSSEYSALWPEAALALQLSEAIAVSCAENSLVDVEQLAAASPVRLSPVPPVEARNETLPLQLL